MKLRLISKGERKKRELNEVEPTPPEFCDIHLELEVINLLEELDRKRKPRKEKLLSSYLELKKHLGKRPTYLELHLYGREESKAYKQEFKSYVGFLAWANELDDKERRIYQKYKQWIEEVESTSMSRAYKMVVLLAMLERGIDHWHQPITAQEVAPFFRNYYKEKKFRMNIEFSKERGKGAWLNNDKELIKRIETMPMTKWSGSSKGLISFTDGEFKLNFEVSKEDTESLYSLTREICEYRLHSYFERKAEK